MRSLSRAFLLLPLIIFASYQALYKPQSELSKKELELVVSGVFSTGDLILRRQSSVISHTFAKESETNGRFSHIGIIQVVSGVPYVVHVESVGSDNDIHQERLSNFIRYADNYKVISSLNWNNNPKLEKALIEIQKEKITFDYDFKLDNGKLYCSELIYEIARRIGEPGMFKNKNNDITIRSALYALGSKKLFE